MTSNRIIEIPEAAPGPDLRANAFVGAWERIEAAQKLKVDPKNHVVDPLPELYWATIAEAAVLAQLANADEDPGRDAGRHLLDRKERAGERRAHFADAIRRKQNPAGSTEAGRGAPSYTAPVPPVTPISEGDAVRVTRGDWADRLGIVAEVYPHNEPPIVDVALFMRTLNEKPTTITVLPADVELIVGADQ